MRFCVFGAGAIGGYLAVELALAGHDVCIVARGPHLKAIQERGLKLVIDGRQKVARVAAADDPRAFSQQDFVICSLKAHQAYDSAPSFETAVKWPLSREEWCERARDRLCG
jgi:2-dehydropantoate 2-reductase